MYSFTNIITVIGQIEGHGVQYATFGRSAFDGGRQTDHLYHCLEGVDEGYIWVLEAVKGFQIPFVWKPFKCLQCQFCDRRSGLPVHLPSFQASMCTMGFHNVDEGSADPTQVMRCQDGHLYRRNLPESSICPLCQLAFCDNY